jgi:hypothetical protein
MILKTKDGKKEKTWTTKIEGWIPYENLACRVEAFIGIEGFYLSLKGRWRHIKCCKKEEKVNKKARRTLKRWAFLIFFREVKWRI